MKKGVIFILLGGIAFIVISLYLFLSSVWGFSVLPSEQYTTALWVSFIVGLIVIGIGIIIITISDYQDPKRIQKRDRLLKKDWGEY
jgi:uncharacterized membrane protein YbhN (UPF0104 family)